MPFLRAGSPGIAISSPGHRSHPAPFERIRTEGSYPVGLVAGVVVPILLLVAFASRC
jgi:hypothetical protein